MEFSPLTWMSEIGTGVLCVIACVLLLSSYVPRWWMSLKYKRLPPGPFCWPLVGFVPGISVTSIVDRLKEVSTKFGGIFGFFVGSRYVVFIDDFQALKKAFGRQEFLGRPPGVYSLSPDKLQTSVTDEIEPRWSELKRFWQSSTRLLGANSQPFRSTFVREISLLVRELETREGEDVDVHRLLEHPLFNLGFSFAYGETFKRGHQMLELVHESKRALVTHLSLCVLKYIFPLLEKPLNLLPKRMTSKASLDRLEKVLSQKVKEHEQTLDPNDPRDFVDLFLLQMQKPGMEHIFNEKTLIGNSKTIFLGFTITICTTMEWFYLHMAAHPGIQTAIHDVIDLEIGREREPLLTDRPRMPLLDAAIMESMRCRYVAPFVSMRSVLKDTTLNGYAIPKDTMVLYNPTSLFKDPKYWPEPERFNPSRFLSENECTLEVPEHFIPYGVGKRTSLGESSSGPIMFLFAASLLQRFRILPPDDGIHLKRMDSLLNRPAQPFVKFQRRFGK